MLFSLPISLPSKFLIAAAAVLVTGCASTSGDLPSEESERQRLAHTRLQLAAMHLSQGRSEVAMDEVNRALAANSSYADAYNLRGWIFLGQTDFAKADADFERALRMGEQGSVQSAETRYNLGWSQCQQNNFGKADTYFDQALEEQRLSERSRARTLLAKAACLRLAGEGAQVQLPLIAQAFDLDSGNPGITFNYARALFESGQAQKALFYARRLNQSEFADAASLWLGIRIERQLGQELEMRQLAQQLQQRFVSSKEWDKFQQGIWDE